MAENATEPPASAWPVRPATPLALEKKPRLRVSPRTPALAASIVTATRSEAPAARLVGATTENFGEATTAVRSRLSWKSAFVTVALARATLRVRPPTTGRMLPRATGAAEYCGLARS